MLIGSAVLDVDLVLLRKAGFEQEAAAVGYLYAAISTWTIVYEGTYSFQDPNDDFKARVMSLAVGYLDHPKRLLSTVALVQVGFLVATGCLIGARPLYFTGACVETALSLVYMLCSVDLTKPVDCWWWFRDGRWFVGCSITVGFLQEYLGRRYVI